LARKHRVYELGRHYGVDSKTIMALLQKMKVEAKSHMSIVEDGHVDKIHAVFQRKREIARINYAKAHGLDPDKLKHVASLKPLPKPELPEEPKKKKAKKKKAVKKKKKAPAKSKIVVIKKTGQKTAVVKKAEAEKAVKEKADAEVAERKRVETEQREQELAAAREEARRERETDVADRKPVAKLVKKGKVPDEAQVAETADAVTDAPVDVVDETEVTPVAADDAEAAAIASPTDTTAAAETEPTETDETGDVVAEGEAAEDAPETEATVETEPETASDAPAAETPAPGGVGMKRDNFKVGDIVRPAPSKAAKEAAAKEAAAKEAAAKKAAAKKDEAKVSSESVKESVKAAIRRRQEEKSAKAEVSTRRKRSRQRKKKVDEAEVEKQLKQTMAQLETGPGKRRKKKGAQLEEVQEERVIHVTEFITVQELAEKLDVPPKDIITKLFTLGVLATMNQRLEKEQIELLGEEFECEIEYLSEYGEEVLDSVDEMDEERVQRPPVVTVMGHVDHGKTSLLDFIRKTNVIAGEAGSITQHIGAYMVETPGGPITFLDTPGHAAFTAMRARGASVTDIVILVVAADDRVMPQTVEAINHAKAAKVPVIVAINKIDLPAAKPDLVKQDLMQHEVMIEEYGGDVLCTEISAKQGQGIDKLLELVHLQSEVLELMASPSGQVRGTVIEARKEPGRGVVFTVLVEHGTLKIGDIFLVGVREGKVRALTNERGQALRQVGPGEPAEVMGSGDVPEAGDRFYVLKSEREAREIAGKRQALQRQQQIAGPKKKLDLENLSDLIELQDLKELPIIIKGDVAGSVEALADQLLELNTQEVQVNIMHKSVGAVSESDVLLAGNTGAMIIGFHLRPGAAIKELAKSQHVTIEVFDIIYEAVDTLKKAMAGLLASIEREVSTGAAQVRQVFRIPKLGSIAGSMVTDGKIVRNSRARLVRDEVVIFEGKINSLKRFKEDAKEVVAGYECGIGLENFHEIIEGDTIEAYEIEHIKRTEL